MELACGEWEGIHWDAIPAEVIDSWMKDFVNVCIPGGESYVQMHKRVTECFTRDCGGPKTGGNSNAWRCNKKHSVAHYQNPAG